MKCKTNWMLLLGFVVAGCASPPSRLTVREAKSRADYVKGADTRLSNWERTAPPKSFDESRKMTALILATKADIRNLETAPASDWDVHKSRIEGQFERIAQLDKE